MWSRTGMHVFRLSKSGNKFHHARCKNDISLGDQSRRERGCRPRPYRQKPRNSRQAEPISRFPELPLMMMMMMTMYPETAGSRPLKSACSGWRGGLGAERASAGLGFYRRRVDHSSTSTACRRADNSGGYCEERGPWIRRCIVSRSHTGGGGPSPPIGVRSLSK